ncbi:PRTRC system protein F [Ramlibacter albus]|uniref:PRTRC system protein F n=1 Tax=Ramlibacter albus TaxID=2079448 RepID=A0A923MDR4_9BURK|nr:PRTRC system protein F [Ramlibacter albus]MBC5767593.1 PRTRC system protein F [Ramlibacter albus]
MSFIESPPPFAADGCFSLPTIDAAVPVSLTRDQQRVRTLAHLARASAAHGIPLPKGNFATMEQVVAAQWSQYLSEAAGPHAHAIAGQPTLEVQDDKLSLVIGADSSLNCFRLKPVVERLEGVLPGLGWYVNKVLRDASCHGHNMYDMSCVQFLIHHYAMEMDEFTDESYARVLMQDNGEEPPETISQEMLDKMREEYAFWPSQMAEDVDGWVHLICGTAGKKAERKPARLSEAGARAWAKANPAHPDLQLVSCALRLAGLLKKDDRSFCWYAAHKDDDTDCIGAACFVAWDDPNLLFEAISHHEQNQYQSGQAVEAFARYVLPLHDEPTRDELAALVKSCKRYFQRWALLAELLSFFPTTDDDDET